jgi:hypothetical protein
MTLSGAWLQNFCRNYQRKAYRYAGHIFTLFNVVQQSTRKAGLVEESGRVKGGVSPNGSPSSTLLWEIIGGLLSGDYYFAQDQKGSKPIVILSNGTILPVALTWKLENALTIRGSDSQKGLFKTLISSRLSLISNQCEVLVANRVKEMTLLGVSSKDGFGFER